MFPVKCKELLPLDHVVIHSVAVRGRLGPLTVWVSNEEQSPTRRGFRMSSRFWTKIYERTHPPSFRTYVELDLRENPIVLRPGQCKAIYVHSSLPGDEAIVYDNRHSRRTYDDAHLTILSGRAHLSQTPFGVRPIGNPWRDAREFVGRLEYGAVYRLWNPQEHLNFGFRFQHVARTLFLCQRRWESPISKLPDDCIFYILNMCRWDWANDTPDGMKELKRRRIARNREAAETEVAAVVPAVAAAAPAEESSEEEESSPSPCCNLGRTQQGPPEEVHEQDEEEYHLAQEDEDEDEEIVEYQEFEDEEEVEEDDDDDMESEDDWEDDDGYGADDHVFVYQDDSEDEEEANREAEAERSRRAWIHRQFARIHVLQALAAFQDDH